MSRKNRSKVMKRRNTFRKVVKRRKTMRKVVKRRNTFRKVVKRRNTMRKVVKRRNTKRRKSIKRRFSGGMPTQNELKKYIIKRYNNLKNAGIYDQGTYNRVIKQLDTLSETEVNKLYSLFASSSLW